MPDSAEIREQQIQQEHVQQQQMNDYYMQQAYYNKMQQGGSGTPQQAAPGTAQHNGAAAGQVPNTNTNLQLPPVGNFPPPGFAQNGPNQTQQKSGVAPAAGQQPQLP
ncbi:unnamed protein product [[Candida] boidinii]|nr:unnamed protein product [[Candida] boidinii]